MQLSVKWHWFCAFFPVAFPARVFTTLPPSSSLPHAGFLFPLIFSSTSSLALSYYLGSTYNISLLLQTFCFRLNWTLLFLSCFNFLLIPQIFMCSFKLIYLLLPSLHSFYILLLINLSYHILLWILLSTKTPPPHAFHYPAAPFASSVKFTHPCSCQLHIFASHHDCHYQQWCCPINSMKK